MCTVVAGVKLYTVPETAEMLTVEVDVIVDAVSNGELAAKELGQDNWMVTEENLVEYLQSGDNIVDDDEEVEAKE
jgi:hypothetical protein